MTEVELAWLAGLLEGEGSFLKPSPCEPTSVRIAVEMTDKDVIDKVSKLWNIRYCQTRKRRQNLNHKPTYRIQIKGRRAAELMVKLKPLMGERRQQQIQEALNVHQKATVSYSV